MAKIAGVRTPLYGYTTENSAYIVEDYPYGFKLRTRARFWLESGGSKGFRFCSQTLNPKTNRWNAAKKSTYANLGAAMYLDDKGHVQWHGLSHYSNADEALDFITVFPSADFSLLKVFAKAKAKFLEKLAAGDAYFTINKERVAETDTDKERTRVDLTKWSEINELLSKVR